jgi:hypothetical protein
MWAESNFTHALLDDALAVYSAEWPLRGTYEQCACSDASRAPSTGGQTSRRLAQDAGSGTNTKFADLVNGWKQYLFLDLDEAVRETACSSSEGAPLRAAMHARPGRIDGGVSCSAISC